MEKGDPMTTTPPSFTMSGGDGIHSYAHNSVIQRRGIFNTMKTIEETIMEMMDLSSPHFDHNIFRIADLGCSVGPNTFTVVKHIIDTVKLKYRQENNVNNLGEDIDFHVFFNDQVDNDFNTLFKNLPTNEGYFAAGVPGSFYDRLFPRNSLHFAYTSYTLHWLSKTPENVGKPNFEAHKEQFDKDMEAFLKARAEELVPGGLMIILGLCTSDGVPFAHSWKGIVTEIFLRCVIDIAKSDGISEEKARSFNLLMYFPNFSEMKEAMERNTCFRIAMIEEIEEPYEDGTVSQENLVSLYRGLVHGILVEQFGEGLVEQIFDRFSNELSQCPLDDYRKTTYDREYVITLQRNEI